MDIKDNILVPNDNFSKFKHVKSELLWGNYTQCAHPKVSVVMPVFNRPEYFRLSLQSVLDQDYDDDYEIVIVDNNPISEEKTQNQLIVEEFNRPHIFYYRNGENIGMFGNWNRCIELARSEFLTYCHDDDMLLPTALSRLMYIQKITGNKAIFSEWNKIDKEGTIIYEHHYIKTNIGRFLHSVSYYNLELLDLFLNGYGYGVGCLFNRENLLKIGGYNEAFYPSADYALMILYTYSYGAVYNAHATFNYRVADNESINVYDKFSIVDKKFRNDIKGKLLLPNFLLNIYIRAKYNTTSYSFAIGWGKKSSIDLKKPSNMDYRIVNFFNRIQKIRHLKIQFKTN